jgi:biotin carboxyl carrier protein
MPRYNVTAGDKEFDIELEYGSGKYFVKVNGRKVEVVSHKLGETRSLLFIDNKSFEVDIRMAVENGGKNVFMMGLEIPATVENYQLAQIRKTAGMSSGVVVESLFKAPMPGMVLQVKVAPGDKVKKGQPLLVIEAMKMENIIKAKAPATIKTVHVKNGMSVERGDKLLEFE